MKFRTAISGVKHFYQVVQSVEKVSKKCIIRLSPEHIELICAGENDEGVQVWSKIKQTIFFTEYRVQSNAGNIICAQVVTDALLAALRDAAANTQPGTREVVMKLAKKDDQAVFMFETRDHDNSWAKGLTVSHSVKISILRPGDMEKIKEPLCPEPDVHIVTPALKELRTVVDRLKSFGSQICVSANNSGQLRLSTETDDAEGIGTTWQDCTHPTIELNDDAPPRDPPDPEQHFGAQVSAQSLLKFMSAAFIAPTTCIACICENHCLIMYVYMGEVSDQNGILTFYIPARLTGDED